MRRDRRSSSPLSSCSHAGIRDYGPGRVGALAALTVTTVVAPSVLNDRHPAQNIRTPPVGVAQHNVEEVWRADRHRNQHLGLPKDQRARQQGERGEGRGEDEENDKV